MCILQFANRTMAGYPQGQTCRTETVYDNVANLTFHVSGARTDSFQCLCRKDTVISRVSAAGRVHAQAIKEVTAHPAQ